MPLCRSSSALAGRHLGPGGTDYIELEDPVRIAAARIYGPARRWALTVRAAGTLPYLPVHVLHSDGKAANDDGHHAASVPPSRRPTQSAGLGTLYPLPSAPLAWYAHGRASSLVLAAAVSQDTRAGVGDAKRLSLFQAGCSRQAWKTAPLAAARFAIHPSLRPLHACFSWAAPGPPARYPRCEATLTLNVSKSLPKSVSTDTPALRSA